MKRIASYILRVVLFVLLFLSIKDDVLAQSGFGMGNTLKPVGTSEFPIVLSNQVMGGHHQVATIAERDAIFDKRRQEGMLCTVLNDGTGATKIYQLLGGVENANWVELSTGGNGTVPSGDTVPADGAEAGSTFYETDTNILWVSDGTVWKEVGTGTVKTVSVVTANGVSGTVDNATTAPAITITLGDITPTSVTASGSITAGTGGFVGTSLSTTADADLTLNTGAGKTIVGGTLKTSGAVFGNVRQMDTKPVGDADWQDADYVVNIRSAGAGTIVLPDPTLWAGRILIICNTSADIPGGAGTYSYGTHIPINSASILASKGQMLISNGSKWIMIVGTL